MKSLHTLIIFIIFILEWSHIHSQYNFEWSKQPLESTYQGGLTKTTAMTKDNFGNIYVVGEFDSAIDVEFGVDTTLMIDQIGDANYFVKYDSSGALLWNKKIGKGDFNDIAVDSNGFIYLTGMATFDTDLDPSSQDIYPITNSGVTAFVAKYNNNGDYVSSFNLEDSNTTPSNSTGRQIEIANNNDIIISGEFKGSVDFDPSTNNYFLSSSNGMYFPNSNIYLARYSSSGSLLWASLLESSGNCENSKLLVDGAKLYISGSFQDTIDFDLSSATNTTVANGSYSNFVAQYTTNGIYEWSNTFGISFHDRILDIVTDNEQNVMIVGYFTSTLDFNPSPVVNSHTPNGLFDGFIVKYDSLGNYIWSHSVGGQATEKIEAIHYDGEESIFIVGSYNDSSTYLDPLNPNNTLPYYTDQSIFYAKYDTSFVFQWGYGVGTNNLNFYRSSALTNNDSLYVCYSSAFGSIDCDPTMNDDIKHVPTPRNDLLSCLGVSGIYNWTGIIGNINFSSSNFQAYAKDISSANDHILTIGTFRSDLNFTPSTASNKMISKGSDDIFIVRHDTLGNFIWSFSIGGGTQDEAVKVGQDTLGNIYVFGWFRDTIDFDPSGGVAEFISLPGNTDYFIAKYDSSGNYLDATKIVNEFALDLEILNDEIIVLSQNQISNGSELYFRKYDLNLNPIWSKTIQTNNTQAANITTDINGNIYISGNFTGTVDFDPSAVSYNLQAIDSWDSFIAAYNSSGELIWLDQNGGIGIERSQDIHVANNNLIYVAGTFYDDYYPTQSSSSPVAANGSSNSYILCYDHLGNQIWHKTLGITGDNMAYALNSDSHGNISTIIDIDGTTNVDPGGNMYNYVNNVYNGLHVVTSYTGMGNFIGSQPITSNAISSFLKTPAIDYDSKDNLYLCGSFTYQVDLDDSFYSGVASNDTSSFLGNVNNYDPFIVKYGSSCVNQNTLEITESCESYYWSPIGQTLTLGGIYIDTIVLATGCNQYNELYLTINQNTLDTFDIDACNEFYWSATNDTYDVSGIYTTTIPSVAGCDSTITLNLQVTDITNSVSNQHPTLTASQPGANYQWFDCSNLNNPIVGATNQSYTPSYSGQFAVEVTIGNCIVLSDCETVNYLGLTEFQDNNVAIYPNPVANKINLKESMYVQEYKILSLEGRTILHKVVNSAIDSVSIPHLSAGNYFIQFISNKTVISKKFSKL